MVRASYDAHLGRWGTRERAPMWRAYARPVKPQFRTSVKMQSSWPAIARPGVTLRSSADPQGELQVAPAQVVELMQVNAS